MIRRIAACLAIIAGLVAFSGRAAEAATLYVSEFSNGMSQVGSTSPQIYPQPAITDQTVAITGASVQSSAFNAKTHAVMVECDADCSVVIGANPVATTTNFLMGDGLPYFFAVSPGQKIAVIANTSGGSGTDVNIAAVGGTPVTSPLPVSLSAGSAVIGHVITDTGSTTVVTSVPAPPTGVSSTTVQGTAAAGGVPVGNPVLQAGSDGTNVRTVATDAAGNQIAVGAAASGGSNTGNPVKMGCAFNSALPSLSNGQAGDTQCTASGELLSAIASSSGTVAAVGTPGTAGAAASSSLSVQSFPRLFNGTNYDPQFTCPSTAAVNVTAASTTQIVALSGTTVIRVCSVSVGISLAGTVTFVTGTGTNCGTPTVIMNALPLATTATWTQTAPQGGSLFRSTAGGEICVTAATGNVTGFITYAQF